MADNSGDSQSTPQSGEEKRNREGYRDSDFILLDDLVYAPLHALAKSNQQLRAQVVEAIKSMGVSRLNGQEETIQLKNLNIAYEQVRRKQQRDIVWTICRCRFPCYPLCLLQI